MIPKCEWCGIIVAGDEQHDTACPMVCPAAETYALRVAATRNLLRATQAECERDEARAALATREAERDAARLELARLFNEVEGRSATNACDGAWRTCWCDTCDARRKGLPYNVTLRTELKGSP